MNADPIARLYRWMEYLAFGRALERCRFSLLEEAATAERILILGEGDGRFLAQLLRRNQTARVDVCEASERMLGLARARVSEDDLPRVRFFHLDILRELPAGTYEAIVTNFFLDCFTGEEAARLIPPLVDRLEEGGRWLVGEFHVPARGLSHWHARMWLAAMYPFFRATTGLRARRIPDYASLFSECGMELMSQRRQRWGLLTAECWRFSARASCRR